MGSLFSVFEGNDMLLQHQRVKRNQRL